MVDGAARLGAAISARREAEVMVDVESEKLQMAQDSPLLWKQAGGPLTTSREPARLI